MVPRPMRESIRQRFGPFAPWEAGFSPVPPPLRPGEKTGPPHFVGIGAQRAGTTWWFQLLAAHPQVYQRHDIHKERHFFARFATEAFTEADVALYHRWFPRPSGTLAGEWTPDYMNQPWTAPLLKSAAGDAKVLVMVRDPVERFLSGMAHAELRAASHLGTLEADAVARGRYASALGPWVEIFGSERLLVLQYERCVADPAGELVRTLRFLGLDQRPPPADVRRPVSPTPGPKLSLSDDARRRLVDLYAEDVGELMERFPELDRALWPNFSCR